ncbi:MAG: 2,3-bisphosphoglycerate-independent phosphoglycerate mutase [Clostridia bacterium]
MKKRLTMLAIMDGFGLAENSSSNAISISGTPNLKKLYETYPNSKLGASGMEVGLPEGQMGNSEVGHLNIGAGRIVYQELTRITKSIKDGDFFENEAFLTAIENVKKTGGKLHLYGLLSDGGVHSHIDHLFALIKLAKMKGLDNVYIHGFMDGRDVSPTSGADYLKRVFDFTKELGFGQIASCCGRYYAMDRDNRWERVEQGYNMLTKGEGERVECPYEEIKKSYENGVTDEFIKPIVVVKNGEPVGTIKDGDAVIFFNFRPDRAREITRCFIEKDFDKFKKEPINVTYVCLTQYDLTFQNVLVAFRPQTLTNTLGEYVASLGKTQLRIAETEKYAHVTFFFNGGVEKANLNEDRILIPSPKVATYDMQPEMSAFEVCDSVMNAIDEEKYDLIILNFANCDMVGHTGVVEATVQAVDAVDKCIGKIARLVTERGGSLLITADHGNADKMKESDGSPFTAHSTNPVPLILVDDAKRGARLIDGCLADIAPTLLELMGLEKPVEMTGHSLIKK